jgi:dihydrofolate reductase
MIEPEVLHLRLLRSNSNGRNEMRKLILKMSMSLDGFVCGPNDEMEWIFESSSDETTDWLVKTISAAGLHIMGSRTFQDMVNYWPTSREPIAAPMNAIPKVVFSRKGLTGRPGGTTRALKDAGSAREARGDAAAAEPVANAETWSDVPVLTGDLATEIAALKQQSGGDILAHGGVGFAQSLVETELIDEYHLLIHPIALGQGRSPFSTLAAPLRLHLTETVAFKTGVVAHLYRPR